MNFVRHTKAIETLYNNINELIVNKKLQNKYVAMFGTSKIAGMIIYYLRENGINIDIIIDNDTKRHGESVFGTKVCAADILSTRQKEDIIVLIASSYQDSMIAQLERMGFTRDKNILKVIDLPQLMSDYSFVDRTGYIELTADEIKSVQLKILKHLKKVCEKNNIPYFLCGGTLLGAVRHKGYIPWDDDIDVLIEIHNLKRLVDIMKEDKDFSLISFLDESADYYDEGSLMYDCHTVCDSNHFPMQISMGVSIDIFPISAMPDDEEGIEEYVRTIKKLEMDKWGVLHDKKRLVQANKRMVDYLMSFDYQSSSTVGYVLSRYFKRDIWKKDWFESSVMLEFENEYFPAPQGYDAYLAQLFGNYMELPPIEQRKPHHYFKAYKPK